MEGGSLLIKGHFNKTIKTFLHIIVSFCKTVLLGDSSEVQFQVNKLHNFSWLDFV